MEEPKKIFENIENISIMQRRTDSKENLLKLNIKKGFEDKIRVGNYLFSHNTSGNQQRFYEIIELVSEKPSALRGYTYKTYKAKLK